MLAEQSRQSAHVVRSEVAPFMHVRVWPHAQIWGGGGRSKAPRMRPGYASPTGVDNSVQLPFLDASLK
jgi:hypothetical protein